MSLMGSLYIGTSGLQNSQNALNTTAHNLSNLDTEGYTRQQVQLSDRRYTTLSIDINSVSNKQTGNGVNYSRAKQVRDDFLDMTYRRESGRSMFYQASSEVLEEVEAQLGEMNGEAFQTCIEDLWTAIQELTKDPTSTVNQSLLVQKASQYITRAQTVYDGLSSYQNNLNTKVKENVELINKYGDQIIELNDRIRKVEAGGIEHANDLRDTRNQILDELATLANISYEEDIYGNVNIQIEGTDFVKGAAKYDISIYTDPTTGFYTPFWGQNATFTLNENGERVYNIDGAEVFNLNREISSDLNTDVGLLKAYLMARGDHRADYTDIAKDYDAVSQSVLMNIQAEFDQLVHNVVSKVNDILAEAAGVSTADLTLNDGTVLEGIQYCDIVEDGYMRGEEGAPLQLFDKATTDEYTQMSGTIAYKDEAGNAVTKSGTFWVRIAEDPGSTETLYTVKNIEVNQELMQTPSLLGFRREDGSEDIETAEKLKAAFTEEEYYLNPNVKKKTTFVDYYTDLVSQIANSGSVYRQIYEAQETTVEATESAREQVIGVSSDEELSNMIKFQNAFNASSRYVNVVSEMLEHLLNALG